MGYNLRFLAATTMQTECRVMLQAAARRMLVSLVSCAVGIIPKSSIVWLFLPVTHLSTTVDGVTWDSWLPRPCKRSAGLCYRPRRVECCCRRLPAPWASYRNHGLCDCSRITMSPKIQNNSNLKMKDPAPIRLSKQARMCPNGPIDRFQCQGNKFLAWWWR